MDGRGWSEDESYILMGVTIKSAGFAKCRLPFENSSSINYAASVVANWPIITVKGKMCIRDAPWLRSRVKQQHIFF